MRSNAGIITKNVQDQRGKVGSMEEWNDYEEVNLLSWIGLFFMGTSAVIMACLVVWTFTW
ncbi:hypothetical protein IKP13_05340 [bacterium]|nr:hypothetical protein [bacterium]